MCWLCESTTTVRTCKGCGCTDNEGCWPPCWWVGEEWCSTCQLRRADHVEVGSLVLIAAAAVNVATRLAGVNHSLPLAIGALVAAAAGFVGLVVADRIRAGTR